MQLDEPRESESFAGSSILGKVKFGGKSQEVVSKPLSPVGERDSFKAEGD